MSQVTSEDEMPLSIPVLKRCDAEEPKEKKVVVKNVGEKRKAMPKKKEVEKVESEKEESEKEEPPAKKKRITKKGTEDKRSETSKENGKKGGMMVKKAIEKLKSGDDGSSELAKLKAELAEREKLLKEQEEKHKKCRREFELDRDTLHSKTLSHVQECRRKMLIKI
jgi:hypothetical protein